MKKEEFERRMDSAIFSITELENIYSCYILKNVLGKKAESEYIKSINHVFFRSGGISTGFFDWSLLDVGLFDTKKRIKFRVKWLTDFKEACLKNEFYKGL